MTLKKAKAQTRIPKTQPITISYDATKIETADDGNETQYGGIYLIDSTEYRGHGCDSSNSYLDDAAEMIQQILNTKGRKLTQHETEKLFDALDELNGCAGTLHFTKHSFTFEVKQPKIPRLWFCARVGCDQPGSYAGLWTESKVREHIRGTKAERHLPKASFSKLRVEFHYGDDKDAHLYLWGEDQPGINNDEFGGSKGLYVEIDGKVVYNDLVTIDHGD